MWKRRKKKFIMEKSFTFANIISIFYIKSVSFERSVKLNGCCGYSGEAAICSIVFFVFFLGGRILNHTIC